ncbi:MAG: Cobalt-zinc-cadmium resistance protein CzcA [Myxococcaceae bacterium]|nr:Cobalt-zinc-cadmium resistance protein CzcA [Myxococcaceae bacterium]
MWIVRLALRRPYTFVVLAMLIVLMGVIEILRMPADIYPEINIPVVAVVWSYQGLQPREMEGRITTPFERATTTTVSGIDHIESQTLSGVSVVKIFLRPGTSTEGAVAQIGAAAAPILKSMPPGATPPLIIPYSASNVPILQLGLSSPTLDEQQIFDIGTNFLRPGLATVQGAQLPLPIGGKQRQIVVDLDTTKLWAWSLSPSDVSTAVNAQNLVLPGGTVKIGSQEYPVVVNASPSMIDGFNDLPIKTVNGATVYLRDVAHVRDGYAPQTSLVVTDGVKGGLLPVLKAQGASTLDVVSRIQGAVPATQATLPPGFEVKQLFDQSVFVRGAIDGVVREGIIAAGLTGLMMLLFLGSWRSTLIVLVSIPLSLLVSIVALGLLGQTLNLMTLGGMALAVGVLVDDATVAVENVDRQRTVMKRTIVDAILVGSAEIAAPALVSTLCICIVFVPVIFVAGAAQSLFVPLAMAVVFAMLASYVLSRTLVPTMMQYLLPGEPSPTAHRAGRLARVHRAIERGFERAQRSYARVLSRLLDRRRVFIGAFAALFCLSVGLVPLLGQDFFPSVDAGEIRLHVRAPPGTRIEETARLFAQVEAHVRQIVPPLELATVIQNIGVPISGINLVLGDPSMISSADGEMLVALAPRHGRTADYVRALRRDLSASFPGTTFFFLPADISSQVLSFGQSAPIDVRIVGPSRNEQANLALARDLIERFSAVPGAVDVHLAQVTDTPQLFVEVDRTLSQQVGLTQRDVTSNMLVSLSSNGQTTPSFWLDPASGVQYNVAVQTPQWRIDSLDALGGVPLTASQPPSATAPPSAPPQVLANVATTSRATGPTNLTHHNIARSLDVLVDVDGTDLGSVAAPVQRIVDAARHDLPRGSSIVVQGQAENMNASFRGLAFGIAFAVVLVYLLMVVNFQSWLEPFVILMALPGTLAGIAWMLFLSGTPLSVPALMGALMSIGVATANSILVVTFASQELREGKDARAAAVEAGRARLRPVIMTAFAMILGMVPMSLGLGDGGESNAPLGRAVIGGLVLATLSTLFFVPVMFTVLQRSRKETLEVSP